MPIPSILKERFSNLIAKIKNNFLNPYNFPKLFVSLQPKTTIKRIMEQNKFKRYDSPEQYAEAFQQMIDAREKWREQVREQEAQIAQ